MHSWSLGLNALRRNIGDWVYRSPPRMRGRKMSTQKNPPTLWPLYDDDQMRARLAFECLEHENRRLKDIVVCLSETVLRNLLGAKTP
jgi:hypothetical protein